MSKLSVFASKIKHKTNQKSPELLLGFGLLAFGATVFMASRATLKADKVLEYHKEKMNDMEEAFAIANSEEVQNDPEAPAYDVTLYEQDKKVLKLQTVGKIVKIYAPVVGVAALSVVSILASRNILHKRYITVVGMYNGLLETFKMYRSRVREEVGEIYDRHYMYGTEIGEITEETVDENGKKKKEKVKTENISTEILNPDDRTARFFAEGCSKYWDKNPTLNLMFLKSRQQIFTDRLLAGKPVFLNEVYDELGFPITAEGAFIGWMKGCGDDCVDFGLYKEDSDQARRFVNGDSNSILLEFNHDGIIVDKL